MTVLIAGGGPSGVTLAIDLARRGTDVRVVDKAEEHFAGSRGGGLQSRAPEVFDDLGVIEPELPVRALADATVVVDNAVEGGHVTAGTQLTVAYSFSTICVTAWVAG